MILSRSGLLAGVSVLFVPALLGVQPAVAADDVGGAAAVLADAAAAAPVDDIIVTATRRETRQQTTPIALTAIGTEQIARQQLITARDLAGKLPGVFLPQSGITPLTQIFYIRGIGNSDPIFDPSVAVYVDDVYLPRAINGMTDLTDLERVEILRGPQGTLFGENASAGAIRYVTKTPGDRTEIRADLGYGNYNTIQGHAYFAGPLVPGLLAGSIAIAHDRRDGFTDNPTLGYRVNNQRTTGGRIKLVLTPSPRFTATFSADGTIDRSGTAYYVPLFPIVGGTLKVPVYGTYRENTSYASQPPLNHSWSGGAQLKLSLEANSHLKLQSITALRGFAQDPVNYNNDGQPLVPYSATVPQKVAISNNYIVYKEHTISQEFQALGHYGALDLTAGLYFLHENFASNRIGYVVSPVAATPNPAFPFDQIGNTATDAYAAFAQGDLKLTNALTLTLGGRYNIQRRTFDYQGVVVDFAGVPLPAANPSASANFTYRGRKTWRSFTPKAGLSYQVSPDVFVYASYTKGFGAGGFNNRASTLAQALPYDQEDVAAFEGGIKSNWLNHRLRLNLAGFYNKYNNLQQTASIVSPVSGGLVSVRTNAGKAHTQGFELETTARPVDSLTLVFNATYLDTRFDYFPNATATASATGNRLLFTPRWQLYGSFDWKVPFDLGGALSLGGDVTRRTGYFSDVLNTAQARIAPQTLYNAHASFQPTESHWTFSLVAHNLANTIGYQSLTYGGTPSLWQGPQNPPRTVFFKAAFAY